MREFTRFPTLQTPLAEATEEKDSVSIWFVRQALMSVRRAEGPVDALLSRAGIPSRLLDADQSRVSATHFGALWLAVAAELDDEFFGLDSRRMKVGSFALLCRSAVLAPKLEQALMLAIQYFNVLLDDSRLELVREDGVVHLRIEDRADASRPEAFRVFAHETALIMLHGLACWLIGRRITILGASFSYGAPVWSAEYRSMYSSELAFDQPRTEIRISEKLLALPVVRDEAAARDFLREAPHNFIVKFKDPKSCQARIRKRLRSTMPEVWPSFADLAGEMGMAASTLHRKLEIEGTSFRHIKDDLRRDLAIDRLAHSAISVAEIASELGFAEPSAFHRAFKLWTGLRPGDYRQRATTTAQH